MVQNPETHCDGPECVMRSYPAARSCWYRCHYGLFRNVFSEQITFCFENLTVFVNVAIHSDTRLVTPREDVVDTEKLLTRKYLYPHVASNTKAPKDIRKIRKLRKLHVRKKITIQYNFLMIICLIIHLCQAAPSFTEI